MKRRQEERLREQHLRTLEMEPLHYEGYGGPAYGGSGYGGGYIRNPPGIAVPHRLRIEPHRPHLPPPRPWSCRHGKGTRRGLSPLLVQNTVAFGRSAASAEPDPSKPPCYEEAVLMAEPPPPYSEVLTDTRGLYRKITTPFLSHEQPEKQEQPPSYKPLFLDRGYSSALHLPSTASRGPTCTNLYLEAEHSQRIFPSWTDSEFSARDSYEPGPWHLPVSMPLFGRTTAV
ncbi:proline-rich protein 7 isoform X3 [Podarcis muralis]|nr:proline-rich protein 7 isoform X3 [Podarcis muralis]XP_053233237.1 proline-rich protein 7 isoform X3 [Podarcis raffonei]XP_060127575.1 proline-rich protein 7 isoform X3 [Zootoca vivipara]